MKLERWILAAGVLLSASLLGAQVAPMKDLDERQRVERTRSDARAVRIYRDGLGSVLRFAASRPDLFPEKQLESRRLLSRGDKEAAWSAWKRFLDYVVALDSVGSYHHDFWLLGGESRDRSFLVAYAAFLAQYRHALEWIERAENDPDLDTLLNDPVPELGLPGRTYAQLKFRFLNVARAAEFAALEATYKILGAGVAPELRAGIDDDRAGIWNAGLGRGEVLTAKNALRVVRNAGFTVYFPVQSGIAEWMGDTKVLRPGRSLVSPEQIRTLARRLEPGDILLERREWYLSNVGLPGYWPHAALFVGTKEDRARYFDDDGVRDWVRRQGRHDGDLDALLRERSPVSYARSLEPREHGLLPRVIEAISEGVSFTTLEHSADADSVVVLRPRLAKRDKAEALARAFHYVARPYDFDFDFRTDSALVCTELVFKAYEPAEGRGGLRFSLSEVLGRPVLPANEIARQFDAEFDSAARQLDFVAFLDGVERTRSAVEAGVAEFRRSWTRPKWHILVQQWDGERSE